MNCCRCRAFWVRIETRCGNVPSLRAVRVDAGHAGLGSLSTQDKCEEQRARFGA
jgi:hypothetical protein